MKSEFVKRKKKLGAALISLVGLAFRPAFADLKVGATFELRDHRSYRT